jgi:hypothetical protein
VRFVGKRRLAGSQPEKAERKHMQVFGFQAATQFGRRCFDTSIHSLKYKANQDFKGASVVG